jgi:hypothetical protein
MRVGSAGVLVVLLLLAGCGGGGEGFTEDYNEAVTPLAELGGDPGAQPRDYDRLARRAQATRRNLARLEAPRDARAELRALIRGLDDVTRGLLGVARAARSEDPVLERRAAKRLARTTEEFRQAEDALHRAVEG